MLPFRWPSPGAVPDVAAIPSGYPLRCEEGSYLLIQVNNSLASLQLGGIAYYLEDGETDLKQIQVLNLTDPATDRSSVRFDFFLPHAGYLYGLVFGAGAGPVEGESFLRVFLAKTKPPSSLGDFLAPLISNYVVGGTLPCWPGSPVIGSRQGPGLIKTISLGNPAAGAEFATVTVPSNARWRVRGFAAQLVTAAGGGSRNLRFDYSDGSNIVGGGLSTANQGASTTVNYRGGIGLAPATAANIGTTLTGPVQLHDLILLAGYTIAFVTANLQAADDWGAGFLQVEEWIHI